MFKELRKFPRFLIGVTEWGVPCIEVGIAGEGASFMVLKSKCKTQDHSQVQFFTRRTHRTQHVSVLTVKVYYAERIQSRTDRKKGHVEKSRGNQCKLPRAYSEVIKDVPNPSSNQEHVCVVY